MNTQAIRWALALLALQMVDVGLTQYMVNRGAVELNPLMASMVGTPSFLLTKLGVSLAVVPIAGWWGQYYPRGMMAALRVCVAVYVLVTLSNLAQVGAIL